MSHTEFLILAAAAAIAIGLQLAALLRGRGGDAARFERIERELRRELQASAQATRQEVGAILAQNHAATAQQLDSMRQQIH
jgi:DNA recombination protein RmuC